VQCLLALVALGFVRPPRNAEMADDDEDDVQLGVEGVDHVPGGGLVP
jgi:hypothetical protein